MRLRAREQLWSASYHVTKGGQPLHPMLWETAFCAVFHGIHARFVLASFEFGRTDLTERRMSASLVIEHLDIVKQLHLGLAAAVEAIGRLTLH